MSEIGSLFGRPIGQDWDDLKIWDEILDRFDHFKWIIEFGTWEGAMSIYLFVQAWSRGLWFCTYDVKQPQKRTPYFYNADVLKDKIWPLMSKMKKYPGIIFCDDGNKPQEVKKYHSIIHPNSFIAVHDWGTEFLEKDIPESMREITSYGSTIFLAQNNFINILEVEQKTKFPLHFNLH